MEGNAENIRLYNDGRITLQKLGEEETEEPYLHEDKNFAGDCVYFLQKHFVHNYLNGLPFETGVKAYLKNLEIQEAVYESARERKVIQIVNPMDSNPLSLVL